MKFSPFFIFILFLNYSLIGQEFSRLIVPVIMNDSELINPWAGGFNTPQFSAVDLNNDGKSDLYIFDRNSNFHSTFINEGTQQEPQYIYQPFYAKNFPIVFNFALLRDYNQDGIMDLFAHADDEGNAGIKVYKGNYRNNVLTFDRVKFNAFELDLLTYPDVSGETFVISTNKGDLPAIDDLDNDGDLDILTTLGDSHLAFFKNMSIEEGLPADNLKFILEDDCWGKFYIGSSGEKLTLSTDSRTCQDVAFTQNTVDPKAIHGGSTVSTIDLDGDGDKELFYGDATNPRIIAAMNGGSHSQAWITEQDTKFPNYNTPVFIPDFASIYHLDLDGDGMKDLIAAPNLALNGPDYESAWFYKNETDNENPQFELQKKNFLIEDMIDLGTGAHPAFVDYNADGLTDLVIGNDNRWQKNLRFQPSLFLFENIGTLSSPHFVLVDDNWLDFSQFGNSSYAFTPTFGDMDSDGDLDLIVGERFGNLFYAENIAGSGNPLSFREIQVKWKNIDVGQFSAPFISDLNNDNKPDLIIGERNGNINYLPNQGSTSNAEFHSKVDESPNNNFLGQIGTAQQGEIVGNSTPVVLEYGSITYLATGNEIGQLELYIINSNLLSSGQFELVNDNWGIVDLGKTSHPALADLNKDGFIDVTVGNSRGGLGLFTTNLTADGTVPVKEVIAPIHATVFPNPADNFITAKVEHNKANDISYRIINTLGQVVANGSLPNQEGEIEISFLKNGIYILELLFARNRIVKRFFKQEN